MLGQGTTGRQPDWSPFAVAVEAGGCRMCPGGKARGEGVPMGQAGGLGVRRPCRTSEEAPPHSSANSQGGLQWHLCLFPLFTAIGRRRARWRGGERASTAHPHTGSLKQGPCHYWQEGGADVKQKWINLGRTREFPGGPVVRTLCSQCWGPGFDPWISQAPPTKNKRKKHVLDKSCVF